MDGQQTQGKTSRIAQLFIHQFTAHCILTFCFNILCGLGFGLPPTPPSSLSSDDSEDNQSAEMHTIPSSPASSLSSLSPSNNNSPQAQNVASKNSHSNVNHGSPNSSRGFNGPSSRQPIHTPLISNQPVCYCYLNANTFTISIRLIEQFIEFTERVNRPTRIDRRREAHLDR